MDQETSFISEVSIMGNLRDRFIVKPGSKPNIKNRDPDDTAGFSKKEALPLLQENIEKLKKLQHLLYAENKRAVLVILQAMDAGGKDGTIRHVMGPLNPQGVKVVSFKAPTEEELSHDFLWRVHPHAPRTGEIRVFNRSHYEDVLIVRVHNLVPKSVWSKRYKHINSFENLLADSGVTILKFFLHVSKKEQLERLKARLDDPAKHWKANPKDFEERRLWYDYMDAYEVALRRCSAACAPWFVIPADKKWFRNLAVSQILLDSMESLNMKFPETTCDIDSIVIE
ncbi:MAG: polyphosphate kinase 2 family protein [Phycisphaerales bacterium]|nr:MAG: polyphosphate kinase 2 family protein [Phycisphaerales bacterium]